MGVDEDLPVDASRPLDIPRAPRVPSPQTPRTLRLCLPVSLFFLFRPLKGRRITPRSDAGDRRTPLF
jgi:hypothetical protein